MLQNVKKQDLKNLNKEQRKENKMKLILNMEVEDWDTFNKVYVLGDNTNRENAGIKKIFIGHEEDKPTKVHAIFDITHSNAMREYMDNPEAKKMAQESGIKFETLFGVNCKD